MRATFTLVNKASTTRFEDLVVEAPGAEPVRITGDVEKQGDLLILRADPKSIQRL